MSAASFFWASSLMVARPLFNWLVSASTSWFRLSYSAFLGPNLLLISVAAFCPSLVLAMACDMLMIAILARPAAPAGADPGAKQEASPAPPAGSPVKPSMLPSVDRRPTARMPLPAKAMRIGRIPGNDLVLSDLDVSRHHAELRKSPTGS